jgi:hypothetical protein
MVHASGAGCEGRGNLCQFGQHRCGDVRECHLSFMKVGGGPPVHLPGKTLGSVRAATSVSLHSFLNVLLGTVCYATHESDRSVLGILWRAQRLQASLVCRSILFGFFFLFSLNVQHYNYVV